VGRGLGDVWDGPIWGFSHQTKTLVDFKTMDESMFTNGPLYTVQHTD
jgi:hypothetical protein